MAQAELFITIGRVVFGLFFVIAGIRNFANFGARTTALTNYGFPLHRLLLVAGFGVQLVAGLALVFGLFTTWAAIALIVFLVLATAFYHNLFRFEGDAQAPHLYATLVNITLAAGLLQVIGTA
ncbi:DoxX family protein [Mariluticola halotolerans]|uniref:DoxX family protein n=1 Tax=Mariluticola halotolerans TaxID=2909283 RepID=UPI0026E3DBBE|nr:DoxX family protein [Mariluticola halotolerans]UJQ93439.1 DoxX family protein [Mariluticola halotolerans]